MYPTEDENLIPSPYPYLNEDIEDDDMMDFDDDWHDDDDDEEDNLGLGGFLAVLPV